MPLQKLVFRPGVNRENTNYANEGGWYDCDKVRFRSGFPEKIGGWVRYSDFVYDGVARTIKNWVTLSGESLLGVGTNTKAYVNKGGAYYDITPIRFTTTLANNPFTTIAGSTLVTVNSTGHGATDGSYVTFTGATSVGGLNLNGEFQINFINSETYQINALSPATSDATGGGASVSAAYQVNAALPVYTIGVGWGAGAWPTYSLVSLSNAISFTASSNVVTVTDTAHGLTTNDFIYIQGLNYPAWINNSSNILYFVNNTSAVVLMTADTIAGMPSSVLLKAQQITTANANAYTFQTKVNATSNLASTVQLAEIRYPANPVRGWGNAAAVGVGQQLGIWNMANFGQDLLYGQRGGPLYEWTPSPDSTAYTTRGTLVTGTEVPLFQNVLLISDSSRFVFCMGTNEVFDTVKDPLLIRWSEQEDYTMWEPLPTNQAGGIRLSIGSYIVTASQTRQEILVWTDAAVYSLQYLGPPYVWGVTLLQDNISIMGPNTAITVNNVTYWMGLDKFYMYSGRVETLPCSVRQYIFQDINKEQAYQVCCGSNEAFSEVWWFYPSGTSTTNDKYVVYNYLDRVWYYGTINRTAWLDASTNQYPIAACDAQTLVLHENGVDDGTNLPDTILPISAYIQSSDFDIGDGHNFGFVWRILPDVTFAGSTGASPQVTMVVKPRINSGSPYGAPNEPSVTRTASFPVELYTGQVYTRIRGRQMAFRIESVDEGTTWQLGSPRIDLKPDGRR
jgi:hypothetical protein